MVQSKWTPVNLTLVMPTGGRRRRPHPELPAGEVEGGAPEPRGEKLSYLLSDRGGGRRRLAAPAGPGERPPQVQLPHPSMAAVPGKSPLRGGFDEPEVLLSFRDSAPSCRPSTTGTTGKRSKTRCRS